MRKCRLLYLLILTLSGLLCFPKIIFAGLCVWRFPDRDIKEYFDADSYKTVIVDVPSAKKATIEKRLGAKLDPDENQFRFWPVYKKGVRAGTIGTHLAKGDYGAIEVVVALEHDPAGKNLKIRAVGIQRDREKARAALRSPQFLNQFIGKTSNDPLEIGKDIKQAEGAVKSSQAIAFSVKKQLIVFEELMQGK
ncbi:MAG TPA: hypothetical protein PLZ08_10425 [Bacillota bacterium]|nr:hypothetical protein [Bacillota bacterium]HOL10668.1 hypothetical protein [Bacillota bacterium]HPO98353.1 hypothetical protein [Bacillota bacterium]